MLPAVATYKRGLRPFDPAKHARFKSLADYGFTLPTPTYPIDLTESAKIPADGWGMDGNGPDPTLTVNGGNPVGNCGVCAFPAHADMLAAALCDEPLAANTMTSDQTVTLYFTYEAINAGVSWRPPPVGTAWTQADIDQAAQLDNGVDLGDWLLWLFQNGYAPGFVALTATEVDAALGLGFVVIVGVNLNPQADQQFPVLWDVGPGDEPDPSEGHAILQVATVAPTGQRKYVSWGQVVPATLAWSQACPQQFFAALTREQAEATDFPYDTLLADLKALGGTVVPPTPTPSPAPTPAPTPSPGGGCAIPFLGRRK
jgi:hypothetical protein